jgi:hypothetical protein
MAGLEHLNLNFHDENPNLSAPAAAIRISLEPDHVTRLAVSEKWHDVRVKSNHVKRVAPRLKPRPLIRGIVKRLRDRLGLQPNHAAPARPS